MTRSKGKPVRNEEPVSIINKILPTRLRLKCRNKIQKDFSQLITDKEIIIASGPAGVGKSYVAIARAIELVQNKSNKYSKIMIINPAVEAEEKLGFMPGTAREKLEPYVASSLDILDKIMGKRNRLKLEEEGVIIVEGLGFIRGKTIDNTILVMEEAQNMSPNQMKTLLTRIGEHSKFIISGDLNQSDRFRVGDKSGLYDAVKRHGNLPEVGLIEFTIRDIVRNPIISKILRNYEEEKTNDKRIIKGDEGSVKHKALPMEKGLLLEKDLPKEVPVPSEPPKKRVLREPGFFEFPKLKAWFNKNVQW